MKLFFLSAIFISSLHASPMETMEKRISAYQEANSHQCLSTELTSGEGIHLDVTCSFTCAGKLDQKERVRGSFIPLERGLFAGNGSTEGNPLWSSVGVSMKSWTQDICLEKALESCKSLEAISKVGFDTVESGEWKISQFPDCHEKELTLSPFNNSVKVNRIKGIAPLSKAVARNDFYQLPGLISKVPLASVDLNQKCKRKIKASICYGDCVDLSSTDFVETLATKEPLGRSDVEICGDSFFDAVSKLKPSEAAKKMLCESYFWNSLIHDPKNMFRSCAAIRGAVDCSEI
jgi:hypothetical protein